MIPQQCKSVILLQTNLLTINFILILCCYYISFVCSFWILPSMVLKKMVMGNFATEKVDGEIIEAIDFMVERV